MHTLLVPLFIILLYALARSADLAIVSALAHSYIRAACYGIVAILAIIVVVLAFFH